MDDFLKWGLVGLAVFLLWRNWRYGATANLSIAPNYGCAGYGVPSTGYEFMGPGMVIGVDPTQWAFAKSGGSVASA